MAIDTVDWQNDGISIDGAILSHLEYADDSALVAKSRPELERELSKLMRACITVGLIVNDSKTVLLSTCTTTRHPVTVEGKTFYFHDKAIYLGTHIDCPRLPEDTLNHRIGNACMHGANSPLFSRLAHFP